LIEGTPHVCLIIINILLVLGLEFGDVCMGGVIYPSKYRQEKRKAEPSSQEATPTPKKPCIPSSQSQTPDSGIDSPKISSDTDNMNSSENTDKLVEGESSQTAETSVKTDSTENITDTKESSPQNSDTSENEDSSKNANGSKNSVDNSESSGSICDSSENSLLKEGPTLRNTQDNMTLATRKTFFARQGLNAYQCFFELTKQYEKSGMSLFYRFMS
jgi:hypothetical protein